jgi:NitT/TauT family transport system substrate-binding protein
MRIPQPEGWTRRCFLGGLTLAGTAGLVGLRPARVRAEPPPETTTLRANPRATMASPVLCLPR